MAKGKRYNAGKPRLAFNLLSNEVSIGEARVWEKGALKYSPGNWLKGMAWTESADSILRHLSAFLNGEDCDSETGLPHVDHIVCSAKILSNSYHTRRDLDDRAKEAKKGKQHRKVSSPTGKKARRGSP